jgi:hypothetical protein
VALTVCHEIHPINLYRTMEMPFWLNPVEAMLVQRGWQKGATLKSS